jgi:eukaryotic-like serine/threonine-protein kinase
MTIIDRQRWQVLEPLLDHALDLEPVERDRWLAEMAAGSPMVAAELTMLLGGEAVADRSGFLAAPLDLPLTGTQLGHYRLERPLGQGGMGTVWLASRADGRFEGQAAVKILNLALLTSAGQERFRREGSVLARLTHPGIARLLDAGVTGAGQPYLVLEHVDGQPIDVFVREHKLATPARIELFLQVLSAVGHAHTNLIVHRDLKPSNILVNADGRVKLLDFGIAKLLDDDTGIDHSALTLEGGRLFTPQCAAPEQVRGEPLTTATDVYALGVLLYLLLSGRHPTGDGARTPAESVAALTEREPVRLRLGDLDNILDQALRKQPADRYQTVAAFADDLGRYLREEPVSARPQSVSYRAGKFVRRNRVSVAAAGLAAATMIVATLVTARQMVIARGERDAARTQRDRAVYQEGRATASSAFMNYLLQSIAPTGKAYTMPELLERARQLLETDYRGDPRFMARMLVELSGHYFELHDRPHELPLLHRALDLALGSGDRETAMFASCRLAKSAADDGELAASRQYLADAARLGATVSNLETDPRVECLRARSAFARLAGHPDDAVLAARQAVLLGRSVGDSTSLRYLSALNELARATQDNGEARASLGITRQVIAVLDRTGRSETLTMLVERYNEASLLAKLGEQLAAESTLTRAVALASGMDAGERPPTYITLLASDLAAALARPDSAVAGYRRALAEARARGDVAYQVRALAGLGSVLLDAGRVREAKPVITELKNVATGELRWRGDLMSARLMFAEGNRRPAMEQYLTQLRLRGFPGRGISTSYFPDLVLDAGLMAWTEGDTAATDSLAQHVLRLARGEGHDDRTSGVVGRALLALARVRSAEGDRSGARDALTRSLPPLTAGLGPQHPATQDARTMLAALDQELSVDSLSER